MILQINSGSKKGRRSIYRGQSGRFAWQYPRKYSKGCKSKTYFDFYGRSSKADEKIGYVFCTIIIDICSYHMNHMIFLL